MVKGQEDDIDCDAEGDEQFCERVKDKVGQKLADLDPDPTAIPDAEYLGQRLDILMADCLAVWTFQFIIVKFFFLHRD